MVVELFTKSGMRGNTLVGEVVDEKDLKMGWLPDGLVRLLSPPAVVGPKSYSSQLKVTASPSASPPVAVNSNGVDAGMTRPLAPASTVGMALPVDVLTAQELPPPLTVKATISLMLWLWKWSSELLCKLGAQIPA